jgi:hypothetical protein
MRILFDHGTPRGLAELLPGHTITTAKAMGWERLSNGNLLKAAEEDRFDVLLTTDKNIRYQQNLSSRKIAIVVLTGTTRWSRVQLSADRILLAVSAAEREGYLEVFIPFKLPTSA